LAAATRVRVLGRLLLGWSARRVARSGDTVRVARFADELVTGRAKALSAASAQDLQDVGSLSGGTAILRVADWVDE
jgi:hypothetical protein